jgi:hypothetical protein
MKNALVVATLLGLVITTGCATQFTAESVRAEIVRQTGAEPQKAIEVYLGPVTMALARQVLVGPGSSDETLPLAGLSGFQLAVYGVPAAVASGARPLDFSVMKVRGWEPTLKMRDGLRSGLVLTRASKQHIGDLVMLTGNDREVIFARLRGTLSRELPIKIGEAVKSGTSEAVRRELQKLTEPQKPPAPPAPPPPTP